jgi:acyl-CoA thioester hydrolase
VISRTVCNVSEQLPTTDIIQPQLQVAAVDWFEYPVRAFPHHTDYGGDVWHGTYLRWLEEARIECLRSMGVEFADLVALGCNLPVVELSIRYHRSLRMGMDAIVKTRLSDLEGVRLNCDYQVQSPDGAVIYATARVTLVAVDLEKGKIMRQLPPVMKDALLKVRREF